MEIIKGLENLVKRYPNPVLTIGNYDGIHLGHQKILDMVLRKKEELNGTSMVMSFDPHPVKVLAPERNIKLLTTTEEKARLLEKRGIDVLLCVKFDKEFSRMLPDDFIQEVLVNKIGVKEVIVGTNYAFGRNKKGTIDLLRRRGEKFGFNVKAVRDVMLHGHVVSSSTIRSLLMKGAVIEVSKFLGRASSIEGTVIKGKGRGQSILRIPTANISTPVEIAPKEGVYAVKVRFNGTVYDAVANIGKNPTFGNAEVSYEVHIFNFSGDLLGKTLRIYFIDRIRGEKTFPDPDSLGKQIQDDIETARELLAQQPPIS